MTKALTQPSFNAFWKSIFSRPCLLLLVLCAISSVTEGRPKTLKKCGRRDSSVGKIVGGKEVQPGDYPWLVSLQVKQRYRFRHVCGGTIINEHYIVTAAHCLKVDDPRRYEIITGLHRLSEKSHSPARRYKISQVILHENFDRVNDIALLRTKEPIRFEESPKYVNGICLPLNDEDPTGWAITAGWGDIEEDQYEGSDEVRDVKVPLVSRKECFSAYNLDEEIDSHDIQDTQICAGIVTRDSCQGDSGGPLMQRNERGVYTLIGIVSWGTGCGRKTFPGVYTKVASYMDWLEENMVLD